MKLLQLPGDLAPGGDFPDSRIGASLKPIPRARRRGKWSHFPDSRIGASLKRASLAADMYADEALPRFANRGLIEAMS